MLPRPTAEQQQTVDQLLNLIRDAQTRRWARLWPASWPESWPHPTATIRVDLALLAPLGGGDVAVLVVGDVDVTADGAEGQVTVSGRDSLTWVDRVLRAPTHVRDRRRGGGSSRWPPQTWPAGSCRAAG